MNGRPKLNTVVSKKSAKGHKLSKVNKQLKGPGDTTSTGDSHAKGKTSSQRVRNSGDTL